jgi:hypothetical protein
MKFYKKIQKDGKTWLEATKDDGRVDGTKKGDIFKEVGQAFDITVGFLSALDELLKSADELLPRGELFEVRGKPKKWVGVPAGIAWVWNTNIAIPVDKKQLNLLQYPDKREGYEYLGTFVSGNNTRKKA